MIWGAAESRHIGPHSRADSIVGSDELVLLYQQEERLGFIIRLTLSLR